MALARSSAGTAHLLCDSGRHPSSNSLTVLRQEVPHHQSLGPRSLADRSPGIRRLASAMLAATGLMASSGHNNPPSTATTEQDTPGGQSGC